MKLTSLIDELQNMAHCGYAQHNVVVVSPTGEPCFEVQGLSCGSNTDFKILLKEKE